MVGERVVGTKGVGAGVKGAGVAVVVVDGASV